MIYSPTIMAGRYTVYVALGRLVGFITCVLGSVRAI